ncbi:MAG: non-ribosomal peptide synthetase, partial [Tumebacillaceae bacterium]
NNIALRARLSQQMTFRELINHVGAMTLDAYANEDLPFDRVVEAVNPERILGIHPLYQVMFSFHDSAMPELKLPDLEMESKMALNSGTAKFDLNIVSIPHPVPQRSESNADEWIGLTLIWDFSTDLWLEETASRMLEHYLTMLKAMVRNPDQLLTEVPMLSEEEQQRLMQDWNGSGEEEALDGAVHEWFEKQAMQTPDHTAVMFGEESLTYRELNQRANRLAHYLRANGVTTGDRVGLFFERSTEVVVCVLAVLKAGGTYVPLDPAYPQERLTLMLEDTQVAVVLSVQGLTERLPEPGGARVICLDREREFIDREPVQDLTVVVSRDHPAYVIFTSGSTGRPKGVIVPHRGIVRLVKQANFVTLTEAETVLQFAPISFDASVFEMWSALLNGGRLVVFPPHLPTLKELGAFLVEHKVTTLWLTAGLFHQMVEEQFDDLRYVRQLLSGGDVLSVAHVKKVLERRPDITLVNGYGPTENTVFTTVYVMNDVAGVGTSVSIGRPIAGTQVYVLDRNLQPVPQGVTGELCTSGEGLADGYLHRPELTAKKFVPHPFVPEKGKLLYRTGDLVRWRSDGNLEFVGRVDNQVKIRGFRIELGEIETQLGLHPEVREVSVIAREDVPGDKRLVAYLVLEADSTVTPQELRRVLKTNMPDYMIPSAFVTLDALPLTPNGKVDTRALPQPERAGEDADIYVAPTTVIEQQLALLWQELFGRSRVGLYDHFFHIGGSSLLALKLLSRLRNMFQVEIPLQKLFERPVLLELAAEIEALKSGAGVAECSTIQPRADRFAPCPLSFDQEELWQLEREEPGNAVYNTNLVIHLDGELQVEVLERSIQEIIRRHDALRTRFEVQAGAPMMVVMPDLVLPLPLIDLQVQQLSLEQREAETKRCAVEFATHPFDLTEGPLVRMQLLRKTNLEHTLLVTMHHIITDGWSLDVFLRELSLLYTAFLQEEVSPLPELPIQFADYVLWQRETMKGEQLERLLSYWKKQMSRAPKALELPTDR